MPLVRIDTTAAFAPERRRALGEVVHRAMIATLGVPEEDRFQVITAHEAGLVVAPSYLGISHGADPVLVQITLNAGRTVEQKRAFYRKLADDLHAELSVRREDVIISLVEVTKECGSFGNGEAQYAK